MDGTERYVLFGGHALAESQVRARLAELMDDEEAFVAGLPTAEPPRFPCTSPDELREIEREAREAGW